MKVRQKLGDPCTAQDCGFPLHGISGDVLAEAVTVTKPVLRSPSLPDTIRRGGIPSPAKRYLICPRCDAYGLGAELIEGFKVVSAEGQSKSISEFLD